MMSKCDTSGMKHEQSINSFYDIVSVTVDGRKLTCVEHSNYDQFGLSCNWEKYNKENKQ